MSIVQEVLREMLGKEVAVVCLDSMAYRGRLEKFDEEAIVLQEALELRTEDLHWVEPTLSPRVEGSDLAGHVDAYGVVDTQKMYISLRHLIVRIKTITRIWPWTPVDRSAPGQPVAGQQRPGQPRPGQAMPGQPTQRFGF